VFGVQVFQSFAKFTNLFFRYGGANINILGKRRAAMNRGSKTANQSKIHVVGKSLPR
jgi:hypothetical protein